MRTTSFFIVILIFCYRELEKKAEGSLFKHKNTPCEPMTYLSLPRWKGKRILLRLHAQHLRLAVWSTGHVPYISDRLSYYNFFISYWYCVATYFVVITELLRELCQLLCEFINQLPWAILFQLNCTLDIIFVLSSIDLYILYLMLSLIDQSSNFLDSRSIP